MLKYKENTMLHTSTPLAYRLRLSLVIFFTYVTGPFKKASPAIKLITARVKSIVKR